MTTLNNYKFEDLSDQEKMERYLPRLELMLSMIRGAHNYFKENEVPCEQFEQGMEILNMAKE
jgi:hypothetical protein